MRFKTPELGGMYKNQIVIPLKNLLDDLDAFCVNNGFPELIVTELVRTARHKSDQHADGEAADIRAHAEATGSFRYNPEQLELMRMFVETKHPRKPWYNKYGQELSGFYPHGKGDVFHVHLSVDNQPKV